MPNDILSIRANLDSLDQQDANFRAAVGYYLNALTGVEKHVLRTCTSKHPVQLPSLEKDCGRLRQRPDTAALGEADQHLGRALEEASGFIRRELAGAVDLAQVLKILSDTTASLQRRSSERETQFMGVATDLQSAAEQEDVSELRDQICRQISQITRLVEEMKNENEQIVSELEQEMTLYRRKLDEAEEMANRDTLTGLANRRVLQLKIEEHVHAGVPFSLLLIDLNRFKAINDQHGHLIGDELLKSFANRLRRQLRADDTSARWGGDEFVVLLPCRLSDAIVRSRLLEQTLRGDYSLQNGPQPVRVRVGLTIGVAEHKQGESADQLLARADQLLYQKKAAS